MKIKIKINTIAFLSSSYSLPALPSPGSWLPPSSLPSQEVFEHKTRLRKNYSAKRGELCKNFAKTRENKIRETKSVKTSSK